jgi:hypothetical protein
MNHEILVCACGNTEHQIIFSTVDDTQFGKDPFVYVSVGLRRNHNILMRLFLAIKYVLGLPVNSAYCFDIVVDEHGQQQFIDVMSKKLNS